MPYRVLAVDDDRDVLRVLHDMLIMARYEVILASDGMKAVELAVQYLPDLILLDVMLPKMSGFQVCRTIRAHAKIKDTPVIMLSAKDSERDREYGRSLGADHYVVKPFDPTNLLVLMNGILQGRPLKQGRPPCGGASNVVWVS